jgi:hypothetical protein
MVPQGLGGAVASAAARSDAEAETAATPAVETPGSWMGKSAAFAAAELISCGGSGERSLLPGIVDVGQSSKVIAWWAAVSSNRRCTSGIPRMKESRRRSAR